MRKVEILRCDRTTNWLYVPTGEVGVFHQFGIDHLEYESGPGMFTTAIVEMSDGTVINIPVDKIRFLDREGE